MTMMLHWHVTDKREKVDLPHNTEGTFSRNSASLFVCSFMYSFKPYSINPFTITNLKHVFANH